MFELIYSPPIKVLGTSFNVQSRIIGNKRLTFDAYGGLKFFFKSGPDFGQIGFLKGGREFWYMNFGALLQLNLGVISPYIDVGRDFIITIGTEVNLHKIYKRPKKRYKLNPKASE